MPTIRVHRKTAAEWNSKNPVLQSGEPGFVLGPGSDSFKIGDGVTAWRDLPYVNKTAIQQAIAALLTSPTFAGIPKAPHPAAGNRSTQIPTTSWVMNERDAGDAAVRNELLDHAFPSFVARTDITEAGKLLCLASDGKVGAVNTEGILDKVTAGIVSFGAGITPTGAVASAVATDGNRILVANYNAVSQTVILKGAKYHSPTNTLNWYASTAIPVATLPSASEIDIIYHPGVDRWIVAGLSSTNVAFLQLVQFDPDAASEVNVVGAAVTDDGLTSDVPQMFYSAASGKVVLVYGTDGQSTVKVRALTVTATTLTLAASGTALEVGDIAGHSMRFGRVVVHEPVRDVLLFVANSDSNDRYAQVKINADGTFTKGPTNAIFQPYGVIMPAGSIPFYGKYMPGIGLVLLWSVNERVQATVCQMTSDTETYVGPLTWIGIDLGAVRPSPSDVQIVYDVAEDRYIFMVADSEKLKFATGDYYVSEGGLYKQFVNIQHRNIVRDYNGDVSYNVWLDGSYTGAALSYIPSVGGTYGVISGVSDGVAFKFEHGEANSGKRWLGFARATALAGESVRISGVGSIVDLPNNTLEIGTLYYVNTIGDLVPGVGTIIPDSTYGVAGRAVGVNKLMVLGNHTPLSEPDPVIPEYELPADVVRDAPSDTFTYVRVGNSWIRLNRYDLNIVTTTGACDLSVSNVFKIVNSAATAKTVSFTNPPAGRAATIIVLIEGNAGAINWPAGVVWSDAISPEIGATVTSVVLLWDGTRYIGSTGAKA